MVKITSHNRRGWARISIHSSIGTMGENMEIEEERDGNEKRRERTERRYLCLCVCVCANHSVLHCPLLKVILWDGQYAMR